MQAISQFDQYHPNVLGHRQEHLAIVFHLLFFFGLVFNPAQLGDAIDQNRNFFAKLFFQLFQGDRRVFDDIMQ